MALTRRSFMVANISLICSACVSNKIQISEIDQKWWQKYSANSNQFVDHTPWGYLLEKYILIDADGNHLFAYGDVSRQDKERLDVYIHNLSTFSLETLNRREQYAYWLNLYNALMVRLVLSEYLVLSINDIKFGLPPFTINAFNKKLIYIKGQVFSLNDIRFKILIPLFGDPRIHYGLCDAAIGSPNIQMKPFTGDWVDRMLDGAALDFINHKKGLDTNDEELILSRLFIRYQNQFGSNSASQLSHIKHHLVSGAMDKINVKLRVIYQFDWALNDGTGMRN